jgi:hypothetical protein
MTRNSNLTPENENQLAEAQEYVEPSSVVEKAFEETEEIEQTLSEELHMAKGPELAAVVDDYLVDKTEYAIEGSGKHRITDKTMSAEILDDTETVLIRGASEESGESKTSGKNPILTLENDGYPKQINEGVMDLNSQNTKLPNNKSVVGLVIEVINQAQRFAKEYKEERQVNKILKLTDNELLYEYELDNNYKPGEVTRLIDDGLIDEYSLKKYENRKFKGINKNNPIIQKALQEALINELSNASKSNVDQSYINDYLNLGGNAELLMQNQGIKNKTTDYLVQELLNKAENYYFSFSFNGLNDEALSSLMDTYLKDPKNGEIITEKVDIQKVGDALMKSALESKEAKDYKDRNIEIINGLLVPLGFEPFKDKVVLLDETGIIGSSEWQERLNKKGLWQPEWTDYIYQKHWQEIKSCIEKKENLKYSYLQTALSPDLEPSEDNKAARYWQEQSKVLGGDALAFISNNINITGKEDDQLFNQDGMPTENLFKRHDLVFSGKYLDAEDLDKEMLFLNNNINRLSPDIHGYTIFLNSIPDKDRLSGANLITDPRNDLVNNSNFDESGATPKLWQQEFSQGNFDFILSRGKEELIGMQLSEQQDSILKLYTEIKDNNKNISEINNYNNETLSTLLQMPDKHLMITKWLNFPPDLHEMDKKGQFLINENNILSYLSAFINLDANDWATNNIPDSAKSFIKETFQDTANKNMVMDVLQKYWKDYLKSDDSEAYPTVLQLMAQHNLDNDGAGPLSQTEAFLNYMTAFQSHKDELFDSAKIIEERLKKERWETSAISDFYNVSSEVIAASPDIYKDFIEFFNGIPDKKDFDMFINEIYPLYKAELTLQAEYTGGGWSTGKASKANYSHLDIVKMRTDLRNTLLVFNLQELSPERQQDGVNRVREIILGEIKEIFSSKFSITESATPTKFSSADIRIMTDMTLYHSNLAGRLPEKESLIGLFAALQLNKNGSQTAWDTLRQGNVINAHDFLTSEKAETVNAILARSKENDPINVTNTGLGSEMLTEFKADLQQEVESIRLGNIQTIDMRLSNVIGNIEELCDPDLYPQDIDKRKIRILRQFPAKTVSAVSAKMYQSASGRQIKFNDEERSIQSELTKLLNDENKEVTSENIKKYLQDGFSLIKLPFNISQKIMESGARDEIIKLQRMLSPSPEIMSIFNRIGEQFSTQSGALALGADLDFLENLVVKREGDLSNDEKNTLHGYITLIREQMLKLEQIYASTVNTFSKTEKSINSASPELAAKVEQISHIINGVTDQKVITSVCSNQMTTIVENMRQCLSAKSAGINNDTDLTFGEGYKFYLYSHNETNPQGSIADEIIYLVPTENTNGERKLSFVMDQLYGQKTSDVFLGHTETLVKKMRLLHEKFPDVNTSIFIPQNSMASVSLNSELLTQNLGDSTVEISTVNNTKITVPQSAFGDHYIEFGGYARGAGERIVNGIELKIKSIK